MGRSRPAARRRPSASRWLVVAFGKVPFIKDYKIDPMFLSSAITVALCSLWATLVNTALGVASVDKDHMNVARVLRPGGSLLVGFGPLYNSPYGGHRRMHMPVPWGHRMLPEPWLLRWVNRYRQAPVASIEELGLNKLALKDFLRLFDDSGLEIVFLRTNHGERLMSRVFATLARVPLLRESFSHDIHCILRKPGGAHAGSGCPPGARDARTDSGLHRGGGRSDSRLQAPGASAQKIVDRRPT